MLEINGVKYQLVTLDFETYYAKDYTLSGKMNMSEYIRDPRFHAHGVGIKIGDKPTLWYTGPHIALALREIDWSKSAMIGHNVAFDGFICSHHFGVVAAFYIDTLSMARAAHGHGHRHDLDTIAKLHGLGGKVKRDSLANTKDKLVLTKSEMMALGGYCKDDVNDTRTIFDKLHPFIPDDELELIDITMRMFCDPVLEVDIPLVEAELAAEVGGKMAALLTSGATPEDLMSNDKFARLLVNADPNMKIPVKVSPSTGKPTYAFAKSDLAFQEMMRNGSTKVKALCDARLKIKSTIGETRAVRFLEAGRDGMKLPILLNYSGALTHRWSGGNKMNLQNLKRGGQLRRSIKAPAGWSVVVSDSAQIEARVLAWLANQADIVNAFATKQDVYKLMASAIYNLPVEKIDKDQRFIGKICVLGLGFGMGPVKLQQTLKQGTMGPPVDIDLEECQRIVNMYRKRNNRIVEFWKVMDKAIMAMMFGNDMTVGPLQVGKNFIQLPSGLFLQYPGLMGEPEESRSGDIKMGDVRYLNRNGMSKLYGGLLTENCLAAGTEVLTERGWVNIELVLDTDRVHDGVEFVGHGGVVFKSVQPCVTVDGVYMTEDHEVLTDEGWKAALEEPRPYRPDLRGADSGTAYGIGRQEDALGVSLPVRNADDQGRGGSNQGCDENNAELRMHDSSPAGKSNLYTRDVAPSSVLGVEVDAGSLQTANAQSVEELRWARNNGLRTLEEVRAFLAGHGGCVPVRTNTRSDRQQCGVLTGELPLDGPLHASPEPQRVASSERSGVKCEDRGIEVDAVLPIPSRPVFDIVNCGSRTRFVVRGDAGPVVVHNCVQALARCIIGEQILAVKRAGYRVVTSTHDEIVAICPTPQADKCLADMIRIMSTSPDWCKTLPLSAEGGHDLVYSK